MIAMNPTRYLALCYHDVGPEGAKPSGFTGPAAATYKVSLDRFRAHLSAVVPQGEAGPYRLLLTFDDGGAGASYAADALEQAGLRGYFFITTGLIGTPGFVNENQIGELHARGHIIGSHGMTHRGKMNRMPMAALEREWSESARILSRIVGEPIQSAAVPSGFYSPRVAQAAAAAGIRRIFTQQPTTRATNAFGCAVIGRFTMRSWTPPARVRALARGDAWPRFQDAMFWRLRQCAKAVGGSAYGDLRRAFFASRSSEELS
jgi:peptidoglycan/xylan/chitin deacetylase (PgdA/CDA1 family)